MHLSLALQKSQTTPIRGGDSQVRICNWRQLGSDQIEGEGGNSLAGDEADELGDALLDGLLGVLGDLAVLRHRAAHDAANVGDRQVPILLLPSVAAAAGLRRALGFRHAGTLAAMAAPVR